MERTDQKNDREVGKIFSGVRRYPASRRLPSAGELVLSKRSGPTYQEWLGNDWWNKPLFLPELKCPGIEESPSIHESRILRREHSCSNQVLLPQDRYYSGKRGIGTSPQNASLPQCFPELEY